MVDLELISRKGDITKLLGQLAALLIFLSLGFTLAALVAGSATNLPAQLSLMLTLSAEHFMISTTMLTVGLFAVLSWDSTFPNRRDVFVLAPLPVRGGTMFLAKIAAVGIALVITVVALHAIPGIAWPVVLHSQAVSQPTPVLTYTKALPPVNADGIGAVLNTDLAPAFERGGSLAWPGAGAVVGVVHHGVRRIFSYGAAEPDSIFEIGSITKTFTGLLLAQMVVQGRVELGEPVRDLLPAGTLSQPSGREIVLLDLATHRSGLPEWPAGFPVLRTPRYTDADLYASIAKQGVGRAQNTSYQYSSYGFSLLGEALANRAKTTYAALLKREIADPLGMPDTAVTLSPEQSARLIQGHNMDHRPVPPWQLEAFAGAGGIRSTAVDMLMYLEGQLHPERLTGTLPKAIAQSHILYADVTSSGRTGLAWFYAVADKIYAHAGAMPGYSSFCFFSPQGDYAAVVLMNEHIGLNSFANRLGDHIRQRLAGEPAISLASVVTPSNGGTVGLARFFLVYWTLMFAAAAFIYCFVLGLQGLASQLLPRRWFLRISSHLQLATFCTLVTGYILQPIAVTPPIIFLAQNQGPLYWSPSYWFLGLFQQLQGSPALAPLAHRAWLGLAICVSVTGASYLLSYFRTFREIAEEPDILPAVRTRNWLPTFGNPLATAVTRFSIRSLTRSRQHRMILAFYWGLALALVILAGKDPGLQRLIGSSGDPWRQPNALMLTAHLLFLCIAIAGVPVTAAMPLEPRANWIFRITPVPSGYPTLAAVRKAMYCLGLAPVWFGMGALTLWLWSPQHTVEAAGHLAVLGLLGITLTELSLWSFRKIPFTCSYLPGKSQVNMKFIAFLFLIQVTVKAAAFEQWALGEARIMIGLLIVLGAAAAGARWRATSIAKSDESQLSFEEEPAPAVFALDLHRDGAPPR